jgi:2-polyprenyl-3-methyl-5-hydroxy-6-metoxy-1,4-benzoquinol methylase
MKTQLKPERSLSVNEQRDLRLKLNQFYDCVSGYGAFDVPSDQKHCWHHVEVELRNRIDVFPDKELTINVLEVGSGKSGFGDWLLQREIRRNVHWTAHDVTSRNSDFLHENADEIIFGDVSAIKELGEGFDIIISTYVMEHVTNPSQHLDHLYDLLSPGGSLFLFSPRYDIPGYLCPSARHLNWLSRFNLVCQMIRFRIVALFTRRPSFLIQTDLAAFYGPFFRDADAVHWVSLLDLILWAKGKRLSIDKLRLGNPLIGRKDWIVKRFLTCAIKMGK